MADQSSASKDPADSRMDFTPSFDVSSEETGGGATSPEPSIMYNVDPTKPYDGPEFEEYCISEGRYLPASRDRTPCITCPLSTLCQAGFEEQVRRLQQGENTSLTEGCAFPDGSLEPETLFEGLTQDQIDFVKSKVPNL